MDKSFLLNITIFWRTCPANNSRFLSLLFNRSLHDVKATEMGGEVRFKAEVDFDGREITRAYLYRLDLDEMLAVSHQRMILFVGMKYHVQKLISL